MEYKIIYDKTRSRLELARLATVRISCLAVCLTLSLATLTGFASAQTAAPPARGATPVVAPINSLDAAALANEARLQVKVSFEVKHQPLEALLTNLRQQTGVVLQGEPNALAGRFVTAHVKEMSLAAFMDALTKLYGTAWVKSANGYRLTPDNLSHFERGVLQLGNLAWFHQSISREGLAARRRQQQALADEMMKQVDQAKLYGAEGVEVSGLPEDLVQRLRHNAEEPVALNLVSLYSRSDLVARIAAGSTLHVASPPPPDRQREPGEIQLGEATVLAADGRRLASYRVGIPLPDAQNPGPAKPKAPQAAR